MYAWLRLPDGALSNGRVKECLNISNALFVTAERFPTVPDRDRGRADRVDLSTSAPLGGVFRYHIGHTAENDARIRRMRADSQLHQVDVAASAGVGSALRAVAPGFLASVGAPQLRVFAVVNAHLVELSRYYGKTCSAQEPRDAVAAHRPTRRGRRHRQRGMCPWWICSCQLPCVAMRSTTALSQRAPLRAARSQS